MNVTDHKCHGGSLDLRRAHIVFWYGDRWLLPRVGMRTNRLHDTMTP